MYVCQSFRVCHMNICLYICVPVCVVCWEGDGGWGLHRVLCLCICDGCRCCVPVCICMYVCILCLGVSDLCLHGFLSLYVYMYLAPKSQTSSTPAFLLHSISATPSCGHVLSLVISEKGSTSEVSKIQYFRL